MAHHDGLDLRRSAGAVYGHGQLETHSIALLILDAKAQTSGSGTVKVCNSDPIDRDDRSPSQCKRDGPPHIASATFPETLKDQARLNQRNS